MHRLIVGISDSGRGGGQRVDRMQSSYGWVVGESGVVGVAVHRPVGGMARGAVVLAGSAGREGLISYRAVRALAVQLVEAGNVVVRFDYPGEGESFELEPDDDITSRWSDALRSALGLAADALPGAPVDLVGVRLGAAIARLCQVEVPGRRVAVDPVPGDRWLRRERAIRRFGLADVPRLDGNELLGLRLSGEQVRQVRTWSAPSDVDGWVVVEPVEAERHFATMEPHYAERPDDLIARVVTHLSREGGWYDVADVEPLSTVVRSRAGVPVRHVRQSVGDRSLPACLSVPESIRPAVAVLMTSGGGEPMAGPGGLWTQLSQELAERGAAVLRYDRRGVGELSDPAARHEPNPYQRTAVEDTVAAVHHLRDRADCPVVAVGLCIAGWIYARTSALVHLDHIVVFNNLAWQPEVAYYEKLMQRMELMFRLRDVQDVEAQADQAEFVPSAWTRTRRTLKRPVVAAWRRIPTPLWRALARRGVTEYPATLWAVADPAVPFDLHFGPEDAAKFRASRGAAALKELRGKGVPVSVTDWESLDHGLLSASGRAVAYDVLTRLVEQQGIRESDDVRGDGTG